MEKQYFAKNYYLIDKHYFVKGDYFIRKLMPNYNGRIAIGRRK
jgi:hypothetical protein